MTKAEEIEAAMFNASQAYTQARESVKNFDQDHPALALRQMVDANEKILECIGFLVYACKLQTRGAIHENTLQTIDEP